MSWHYLQGQEAESWEGSCLDGAPDALSRLIPIADPSCLPDNETKCYPSSRYGMMSVRLTDAFGMGLLMSSPEDSLVKTSAQRVKVQDSPVRVQDFFSKCCESLRRYSLTLSSRKTVRNYVPRDSALWSKGLPAWGMTVNGACWELGTSVRLIIEIACGYWPKDVQELMIAYRKKYLPTPRCHDATTPGISEINSEWLHPCIAAMMHWPTNNPQKREGGESNPEWIEWYMGWPIGWTDLRPLGMDKYQQWRRSHGRS
jgi:hypothetical protein